MDISVKMSDDRWLPWIFGYLVQCTFHKNLDRWKFPLPRELESLSQATINHHPPRMASRTAGCAFLTSGGKRPTMAPAMAKATGGSLGDDGIGGITRWAQNNRSYSIWMQSHPPKPGFQWQNGVGFVQRDPPWTCLESFVNVYYIQASLVVTIAYPWVPGLAELMKIDVQINLQFSAVFQGDKARRRSPIFDTWTFLGEKPSTFRHMREMFHKLCHGIVWKKKSGWDKILSHIKTRKAPFFRGMLRIFGFNIGNAVKFLPVGGWWAGGGGCYELLPSPSDQARILKACRWSIINVYLSTYEIPHL